MEFEPNCVISVPQDGSCYTQPGWMCGFHFGHLLDEIEEDVLNEKYCVQVLRILITKADIEIDELEKDLVFLQNELAWAEYDDWSEKCCNALTRKLDCLSIKVWSLKDKDKSDSEVPLLVKRQPSKRLHELLKALLNDYLKERDKQNEQPLDVPVSVSSGPPGHAAELLDVSTKLSKSYTVKEEIQESRIIPTKNGTILKAPLMLQEKKVNHSETVKVAKGDAGASNSNFVSLKLEADHADDKKVLSSIELKSANKVETKEAAFTPKDKKVVQNVSLKTSDKGKHNLDMHTDIMFKYSSRNALKNTNTHSNKKRGLSTSDKKVTSDEAEENDSTSIADIVILDSSLKQWKKSKNLCKRVKPTNGILNICDDGLTHSTSLNGRRYNSDSRFVMSRHSRSGNSDVSYDAFKHMPDICGSRNNSDSRLAVSSKGKCGSFVVNPDALQHATDPGRRRSNSGSALATLSRLKIGNFDVSHAAFWHAAGLNQRRYHSDSNSSALRQARGGYCDLNQKLCDFAQKAARKRRIKELKLTVADNIDSSPTASSPEAERDRKAFQRIVKIEKSGLTDNEQSGLPSLLEMQDEEVRDSMAGNEPFLQIVKIEKAIPIDNKQSGLPPHLELQNEEGRESWTDNDPFLQIVKIGKVGPTDNEHSSLPSLLEQASSTDNEHSGLPSILDLQDEEGRDATKVQSDDGAMQSEEAHVRETVANDERFDLGSVQSHKQKEKGKIESNLPSFQEPDFLSIEIVSKFSIISKATSSWKSGLGSDIPNLNHSSDRGIVKKIVYNHQREAYEANRVLNDSQISVSRPQKKRKRKSSLPILVEIEGSTVEMDLSKAHRDPNASAGKDGLSISVSHSIDSCTEAVAFPPYDTSHLRNMKLSELRTIAKEQKLRKYSKLRKDDLIEQIGNRLSRC